MSDWKFVVVDTDTSKKDAETTEFKDIMVRFSLPNFGFDKYHLLAEKSKIVQKVTTQEQLCTLAVLINKGGTDGD
jgi:hypothetical protein